MPKKEENLQSEEAQEVVEASVEIEQEVLPADSSEDLSENMEELNLSDVTVETSDYSTAAEIDSEGPVTVQPVKFASFEDSTNAQGEVNKNLDILMDIKLQMTVELGRTELPVKKVLELTRGSIVELQKVAGEPVELYANGKLVAHGEVVVIEDNFGLRITSITDPEDRLKGI